LNFYIKKTNVWLNTNKFIGEKMKLFSRLSVISTILCFIFALNGCISNKEKFLAKAEDGDPQAQGIIGSASIIGDNTEINYRRAYYWLRLGAASSDSISGYYLGTIYENGLGRVVPDQVRAARHYKGVYKDIHERSKKGELAYINLLAEMYYYGRGLEQNEKKALKMFNYCAKRRWQPAVENLGIILFKNGKSKDLKQAKSLLIEAAMYNFPRAQFYLAKYYYEHGNDDDAMEQLRKSAGSGFPPAMFWLAEEYKKINNPQADMLFKAAADEGYAPAMLVVADGIMETEKKLQWIKRAVEHSSLPAILQYAKLVNEQVNPDPAKEMILYILALKIKRNDPKIERLLINLDNRIGLFFPIKYSWESIQGGENILLANSEVNRVMEGFRAGKIKGSKELYEKRLAYNPLPFFMNNDWYLFYENGLPPMWSALLFKAVERHEVNNPGFWISYGVSAGLAGQGTAQAFAAYKLNELIKKRNRKNRDNSLVNIAALLKANALILLNHDAEAYESLLDNGKLMRDDLYFLLNFINFWCRPLLKDKVKFSTATGIDAKKLGQFVLPQKKEFLNLEYGRVIPVMPKVAEPQVDYKSLNK
jgi:TPR repeat protein